MKPRVYIETSVISYLTSRPSRDLVVAAHQELTRQWWEERSAEFDLFVSDIVMEEAQKGDKSASSARMSAISTLPILITDDIVISFTQKLISAGLVPYQVSADALHIAIASINGIDYLLTWNCKHIANALLRNRITALVENEGYACPVICTPDELLEIHS